MFRQQWQDELQQKPGSRGQSPKSSVNDGNNVGMKTKQANDIENEVGSLILQDLMFSGNISHVTQWYINTISISVFQLSFSTSSVALINPTIKMRISDETLCICQLYIIQ